MTTLSSSFAAACTALAIAAAWSLPATATTVTYFATQGAPSNFNSPTPPALASGVAAQVASFNAGSKLLGGNEFESGQAAFNYTGGSATVTGLPTVINGNLLSVLNSGRYNTTTGLGTDPTTGVADRGKWLEATADFTFRFTTDLSALAFFGLDFGDFDGAFSIDFFDNGQTVYRSGTLANSGGNGNLLFWGLTSTDFVFDAVEFNITQATSIPANFDVLGFDSLRVGTAVAGDPSNGNNGVPEPGSLALAGLALAGAAFARRRR